MPPPPPLVPPPSVHIQYDCSQKVGVFPWPSHESRQIVQALSLPPPYTVVVGDEVVVVVPVVE